MSVYEYYISDFYHECDVSLLIKSSKISRKFEAILDGRTYFLAIEQDEIEDLYFSLGTGADKILDQINYSTSREDLLESLTDIENLAHQGRRALNRIFGAELIRDVFLNKIERIKRDRIPTIEILSEEFILPWDLLYGFDPRPQESFFKAVEYFWGMSMIIARLCAKPAEEALVPYQTQVDDNEWINPPNIALIIDRTLPYAEDEERTLKTLKARDKIALSVFDADKDYIAETQFAREVNEFLNQDVNGIHLVCHNSSKPESRIVSFQLGKNLYLSEYRFQDPIVKPKATFAFLNACSTGIWHSGLALNFMRTFWRDGNMHLVAADWLIQDQVASEFTEHFYQYLIVEGDPLGKAFYRARRTLIQEGSQAKDILSLFYGLYGAPSYKLGWS